VDFLKLFGSLQTPPHREARLMTLHPPIYPEGPHGPLLAPATIGSQYTFFEKAAL